MSKQTIAIYAAWTIAFCGLLSSLYFSEILHLPPCVLCWYQRIAMYPLVIILAIGIIRKEEKIEHYVLPFSITGLIVALYHNLLFYGIIPENIAPCTTGVSCTSKLFHQFGFISIPLLSLIGFTSITILMVYIAKLHNNKTHEQRI